MSASKLRHGSIFVVGSLIAGLLNYFFQVVAARELQPAHFAGLNAWLAHISLFAVSAGLLQYAANFFPSRKNGLRASIIVFNVLAIAMTWFWFSHEGLTLERAIMVVAATSLFGWLIGQAQIRLSFIAMTVGGLVLGAAKLATVFLPVFPQGDVERFALGLFAGYLPGLWALSILLWNMGAPEKKVTRSWTAPVILSLTAVMIPQFDMVLMNHTQRPDVFESFVKASLFYKCIYFWVFIGAQWLLPHQIQGNARSTLKGLLLTFAGALLGALVLTAASPYISTWLLHWATPPSTSLVFWSCLHMSLLTMLFLWIQEMCAHRRPQLAAVVLTILAMEAAAQWLLRLPASTYLTFVTVVQLFVLVTAYVLSDHLSIGPRQKDALPPPIAEN